MIVTVSILGELAVHVDGRAIAVESSKQRELLASLALGEGSCRTSSALVDILWGDRPPASARKNVQVLIGRLRKALGAAEAIQTVGHGYVLDEAHVELSHVQFERELRGATRLMESGDWRSALLLIDNALGRWTGPALGSLVHRDWATIPARSLDASRLAARILRIEAWLEAGRPELAVVELRELAVEHTEDVAIQALYVRALFRCERQHEALEACRRALAAARRGGQPGAVDRLRGLEQDLLNQNKLMTGRRGPELPRIPFSRHPLLGRARQQALVRIAMLGAGRLATIVGPGGAGKTRLAAEVARSLEGEVDDVAWIDLSPAASTDDVVATLLTAFAVTSSGAEPVDALVQAIGDRRIGLVLDNFEQVVDSAGVVAKLRDRCSGLRVLVTSRIALRIEHEEVTPLEPFELPEQADYLDAAALQRLDAVQLFRTRAELVDGLVASDDRGLRDIHRICVKVDGLPLGIELAAARTRLLRPEEILRQLDRTFALITSRSDEHPRRHQSLDNVIAWSYDLLRPREQRAFRILSMFVGGCRAEDFCNVAALEDTEAARGLLDALASSSLAIAEPDDASGVRWRMLETIGSFGRDRLSLDEFGDELRERFARLMLAHTQASNNYLAHETGAEQRFISERSNVHSAFDWGMEHALDIAADIFVSMDRHLHTRGSIFEGDELGRRLMAHVDELDARQSAYVFGLAGRMAHYRGDPDRCNQLLELGLRIAGSHEDARATVRLSTWHVEHLRNGDGDLPRVIQQAEEVRALARAHGDPWSEALLTAQIGFAYMDMERAQDALSTYREGKAAFERLGDEFWVENMEANILAMSLIETREPGLLDDLASCTARLIDMEYWTYAAHVESFRLRCALELEQFAVAASCADDLVPRVRVSGEAILLMFSLACASVAYLEVGRLDDTFDAAWESLVLAVRSRQTLFADYSVAMLACAVNDADHDLGRWIASSIDRDRLEGIFSLDRHVACRLDTILHEAAPSVTSEFDDVPVLERLERLVSRPELVGRAN